MDIEILKQYFLRNQSFERRPEDPKHRQLKKQIRENTRIITDEEVMVFGDITFTLENPRTIIDIVLLNEYKVYLVEIKSGHNHNRANAANRQLRTAYGILKENFPYTEIELRGAYGNKKKRGKLTITEVEKPSLNLEGKLVSWLSL